MTMKQFEPQSEPLANDQLQLDGVPRGSNFTTPELAALVECLLLVASDSPTIAELSVAAEVENVQIEAAISHLQTQADRGWVVQRHGDRIQLATAPRFAEHVRRFLGMDREARLSSAALEALAIIAYRQPATRAELEAIRGVDCSGVLATLHARDLIESVGKRPTIGNPIEYGTTAQFLRHFGLASLVDLPDLGTIEDQDVAARLAELSTLTEHHEEPTPE